MTPITDRLEAFAAYAASLAGDERGEAQVFCDRLFQAFGHGGYHEAGATLEARVRREERAVGFIDLLWKPHALIEMKKRGEPLARHRDQAFDYWVHAVPHRPRYVMLCNFDEFWVYDFDRQIQEPVDRIPTAELPERFTALNFMLPHHPAPLFGNNREEVSRKAAGLLATVFRSLVRVGISPSDAQRFVLRSVVAMFGEDLNLLPSGLVAGILAECRDGASSYDLLGGLFRQMNTPTAAPAGRYANVPYFNGGLYADPSDALELLPEDAGLMWSAALDNWRAVDPSVFGTLFQASMDAGERHARGVHYTSEADIRRVVQPTIVHPWMERIEAAQNAEELMRLRGELQQFKVLDPACGSGNFLYVAYRALGDIESTLLEHLREKVTARRFLELARQPSLVSPRQFYGFDILPFAVELAKVTLVIARKLVRDTALERLQIGDHADEFDLDPALPLDNLDDNIRREDALFADWPRVDAIVSNPPFQSKNKMQQELGREYVNRLRARYPEMPGRADYCVYWFRRAHDELAPGHRAGLVGTNTIRQNYSREGGLDYIVENGGTITEAVSSQVWSGEAAVHVSIVNWVNGESTGPKRLSRQLGDLRDSPWETVQVPTINAALSFGTDVTHAQELTSSSELGGCFQGQTHGHAGFLVPRAEAEILLVQDRSLADVLRPFLTADDLLGESDARPTRYVIDFGVRDQVAASRFAELFRQVERSVLPDREAAAREEADRNRDVLAANPRATVNHHHAQFLARWWQLSWPRHELTSRLDALPRYIAAGQVTKRPIFAFVHRDVRPNAALVVFPFADDYTFGVLQSGLHWQWFMARCSTLTERFRYTSNSVFDTFPWPQSVSAVDALIVAEAARHLRSVRVQLQRDNHLSLRDLYRTLDRPGRHPLREAQDSLDAAVDRAYGRLPDQEALAFLLGLNAEVARQEAAGGLVQGPGLPTAYAADVRFFSDDAVGLN